MSKGQKARLSIEKKSTGGVEGIFGENAKEHDNNVFNIQHKVYQKLALSYPNLEFRIRDSITKKEINDKLKKIDSRLGKVLFISNARIIPDGGIIEVKDKNEVWRIVLISEAKHQGNDIENIKRGIQVGKKSNQDFMIAGNAIERSHKNINEIRNFMINEDHFPYLLFLSGSNFLLEDVVIKRPDGREVLIQANIGSLNRLDRLTSANMCMGINSNFCKNREITINGKVIKIQAVSIHTKKDGSKWTENEMIRIMWDTCLVSLEVMNLIE